MSVSNGFYYSSHTEKRYSAKSIEGQVQQTRLHYVISPDQLH